MAKRARFVSSPDWHHSMRVVRGPLKRAIFLKNGKIIAASGTERKRSGDVLLQEGPTSQQVRDDALERAVKSGRRLGDALTALGYVEHETLRGLIRDQLREAVPDLFPWAGGDLE